MNKALMDRAKAMLNGMCDLSPSDSLILAEMVLSMAIGRTRALVSHRPDRVEVMEAVRKVESDSHEIRMRLIGDGDYSKGIAFHGDEGTFLVSFEVMP